MTLEGLDRLLCQAGRSPLELSHWTWGEALCWLEGQQEAQRRQLQGLSLVAWGAAQLTACCLAGERPRPIYEWFPFWTEEEQNSLRLARYRSMMEGLAAGGERKGKE